MCEKLPRTIGRYDSGRARAIGVSNFSTRKLADLLGVAAVDQVEYVSSWLAAGQA
jgi:alcohol dehydrogenase (NADP+)